MKKLDQELIFKKMYLTLCNQITDAVEALEAQNYRLAEEILCRAQQQAEEQFISQDEE